MPSDILEEYITYEDRSDDDCIAVAPAPGAHTSRVPASNAASREPLLEIQQNKRRRILDHVLIPKRANRLAPQKATATPAVKTSLQGNTTKTPGRPFTAFFKPSPAVQTSSRSFSSGVSSEHGRSDPQEAILAATGAKPRPQTKRPRRSVQEAIRYEDDDDNRDALSVDASDSAFGSPRRIVKAQRKRDEEDEDFHVDAVSSASESESDVDVVDDNESADEPVDEPSDSDTGSARKRKKVKVSSQVGKASGKPQAVTKPPSGLKVKGSKGMKRMLTRNPGDAKGLDRSLPPLSDVRDIFRDITERALKLKLEDALKHLNGRPLRVATMCSGTESPLLALQMISEQLKACGIKSPLNVEHVFSAEIVPFKQAYIERNFAPPIIFRDITEFPDAFDKDPKNPTATTAYGSHVSIPLNVDIMIAGTSCVDYSRQNKNAKGLDDLGESGQTWYGAKAFCKAARPAIIIFENVVGAEWDNMLRHYREMDYECTGALVDTKDFIIPHTRQRGYMVCFDTRRQAAVEKNPATSQHSDKWLELLNRMRRFASSPASDFALPTDQVVLRHQAIDDDNLREIDWAQCEVRHVKYRQDQRLGNGRPTLQWQESGAMSVPDFGDRSWFNKQQERVKDLLEISRLRKALQREYDINFKTRYLNHTQNVDRETDSLLWGIISCLLPRSFIYVSDLGRTLVAEDNLRLQGLPLGAISFTTESPGELLDLAGNAMTTTVVGSALLAAFITGFRLFPTATNDSSAATLNDAPPLEVRSLSVPAECNERTCNPPVPAVAELQDKASRSLRRCYCEGSSNLCSKPLQRCLDCGHTTCIACGGNPEHRYQQDQVLSQRRIAPFSFTEWLKSALPLRLTINAALQAGSFAEQLRASACKSSDAARYLDAVSAMSRATLSLQCVRRTHCWTVSFAGPNARLDFVIDDNGLEWRLHILPSRSLAVGDWLRQALKEPVARSKVSGSDLFPNEWAWRVPVPSPLALRVRFGGPTVPTWLARSGLPDYERHTQPQCLEVFPTSSAPSDLERLLSGNYRLFPRCGTSFESLYRKIGNNGPTVFFFQDPERTEEVSHDPFVFSHNTSRLEYNEVRSILAKTQPSWTPWVSKLQKGPQEAEISSTTWCRVATKFGAAAQSSPRFAISATEVFLGVEDCTQARHVCTIESASLLGAADAVITCSNDRDQLLEHYWAFEAIKRQIGECEWQHIDLPAFNKDSCDCAPPKPEVRWTLDVDKTSLKAYEDPQSAAHYERKIKARPTPVVVELDQQRGRLSFGINAISLAHRALSRLPKGLKDIQISWRLDTTDRPAHGAVPKYTLKAASNEPFDVDLRTITLSPKQRLALGWMRAQETGVDFRTEESEVATLREIGWRAEARASGNVNVRGGICADHPGFGKTILSLAIIKSSEGASTVRAQEAAQAVGLEYSPATLIICPNTLMQQWADEVRDELGYTSGNLTIKQMSDLTRKTLKDFRSAKIIIVNRALFNGETYAESLATFAGMPGPAAKSGRAFGQWLQFATRQIPEHLNILKRDGKRGLEQYVQAKYKTLLESDDFKAVVPSRRLRGKALIENKDKHKATKTQKKAAATKLDTSEVDRPLFEMFRFERMIVDEFHLYETRELAAVEAIQADKRWGLDGTPALGDSYDVSRLASLLQIQLPISSDVIGLMKQRNIKTIRSELTAFERFDAMREPPSASKHIRIHEIGQQFLDTFVRRNVEQFAEFQSHLVPTRLDFDHQVLYTELLQHLNSNDMRIKKGNKAKGSDREERIYKVMKHSETPEEALSRFAAHIDREHDDSATSGGSAVLSAVRTRQAEVSEILSELASKITEAKTKEPEPFAVWKSSLDVKGSIPEQETMTAVQGLLSGKSSSSILPRIKPTKRKRDSESEDDSGGEAGKRIGKAVVTSQVLSLTKRLAVAQRSLRYMSNAQRLHERHAGALCDSHDCKRQGRGDMDVAVSALCGHTICRACYDHNVEIHNMLCRAETCTSSMHPHNLLWKSKMDTASRKTEHTPHGSKLATVVHLLETIRARRDQAILFVQFPEQTGEVLDALVNHEVPHTTSIETFKSERNKTVIVLNMNDETSSGHNLQNANHVIFLSPLLSESQQAYDAIMAQAIGRVRRHKQNKDIHVYRIVALHTIDVDILEQRERRSDAICEISSSPVIPPKSVQALRVDGAEVKERVQLVQEDGKFSLRPRSWLVRRGRDDDSDERKVMGKNRVMGWEDFSCLIKFSRTFSEGDS